MGTALLSLTTLVNLPLIIQDFLQSEVLNLFQEEMHLLMGGVFTEIAQEVAETAG